MKININTIVKLSFVVSTFVFTLLIMPYYVGGDQIAYKKEYNGIQNLNIVSAYLYYHSSIGSFELIHFLFSWIASNIGISKDIFIAFFNSLFVYILVLLMEKWKVSIIVMIAIVFFNFYLIVLYFSAERLKIGIIFLMLSVLYYDNLKKSILFSFLAVLTHMQLIIIYASILFKEFYLNILKVISTGKISKNIIIFIIIFIIPIFILQKELINKLLTFTTFSVGIEDFFKTGLFFILSLIYSKNKKETLLIFTVLLISISIVGDTRINIMSYFIFLYYALQINHGLNMGIIITSLYFGYTSIEFMSNIFMYGNGFYK